MQKKKAYLPALLAAVLLPALIVAGCGTGRQAENGGPGDGSAETGTLIFTANGEEFIREGFLSKDGWALTFTNAYVTLAGITAYQTDPPYDTEQGWDLTYQAKVELPGPYTVDLAGPESDPVLVDQISGAPAGRYNALAWEMVQAPIGPAAGYTIMLTGRAEKDGRSIDFILRLEKEVAYLGGEYIGDERKGILSAGGSAELEMTFHFDHLFGNGEEPAVDPLNLAALGFDPIAALAVDGSVDVDMAALQGTLSSEDYAKLPAILEHLAHVGEGHCLARIIE
jgi:hypothetical protein